MSILGFWTPASVAGDPPPRYPEVWGTIVSSPPDISYMIGALKRPNGEITIFYGFGRDDSGLRLERIMRLDFFAQRQSVIKEGEFEDADQSSEFERQAAADIRALPDLCCKEEIKRSIGFHDYLFEDMQGTLSIAVLSPACARIRVLDALLWAQSCLMMLASGEPNDASIVADRSRGLARGYATYGACAATRPARLPTGRDLHG